MDLELEGTRALVTGATGGIGKACVEELAREGCDVALLGRDRQPCVRVAASLTTRYPSRKFPVVVSDLGLMPQVKEAVDAAAAALGGLDIVVNAAGGSARGGIGAQPHQEWLRRFNAKPFGLMAVCEAAVPHLEKSEHACIVNLSGLHGKEPVPWAAMAGAINAATHGLSKSLAGALGPKGIRVNVVTPGFTSGRRFDELIEITARERGISKEDAEAWLRELVPLGKPAAPEDVAAAVVFLASQRSSMITGAELKVDGGRSRHI